MNEEGFNALALMGVPLNFSPCSLCSCSLDEGGVIRPQAHREHEEIRTRVFRVRIRSSGVPRHEHGCYGVVAGFGLRGFVGMPSASWSMSSWDVSASSIGYSVSPVIGFGLSVSGSETYRSHPVARNVNPTMVSMLNMHPNIVFIVRFLSYCGEENAIQRKKHGRRQALFRIRNPQPESNFASTSLLPLQRRVGRIFLPAIQSPPGLIEPAASTVVHERPWSKASACFQRILSHHRLWGGRAGKNRPPACVYISI